MRCYFVFEDEQKVLYELWRDQAPFPRKGDTIELDGHNYPVLNVTWFFSTKPVPPHQPSLRKDYVSCDGLGVYLGGVKE